MTIGTRPYVKVARAAAEQRTRDALTEAAEDVLLDGDWPAASLESIAARAGVSKQTLLRHFGSKDGLLAQAAAQAAEEVREQRFATTAGDVEGAVDNLLEHYRMQGERSVKVGAVGGSPLLDEIAASARRLHLEWVEHAFGPWLDELRGGDRVRLRAALIAACDVQTWWILSHDLRLAPGEVRATLLLSVRRLLGAGA